MCAKTAESNHLGVRARNHVLDRGQDRTNPFAAVRGDRSVCDAAFFAKLIRTLVKMIVICNLFVHSLDCSRLFYSNYSVLPNVHT